MNIKYDLIDKAVKDRKFRNLPDTAVIGYVEELSYTKEDFLSAVSMAFSDPQKINGRYALILTPFIEDL